MSTKSLIIVLILVLFEGCVPLMLKLYGVKNPKIENAASIRKKAHKFRLDTTNIVTVNSKDFLYQLKGQSGIPDCSIFDSAGNYIEYRSTDTSCNAGLFDFIPQLDKKGQYNKTNKTTLGIEWQKFRDLNGKELKSLPQADFYLLIYWATWLGKLNKDHVKIWEEQAMQNMKCKICVVKVDLDLQQYWDKAEMEKIKKALSKKKKS